MTQGKSDHVLVQDSWFQFKDHVMINNQGTDNQYKCTPSSSASSIGEESTFSNGSSIFSSDTTDDASSSTPSNSGEPLYDLSDIMAQLPIKRGLSKFYHGKSESFISLSRVKTIEDLAKKTNPYRRNELKASKSCGNGLSSCYKPYTLPKPIISKKTSRPTCLASALSSKKGSFILGVKPPLNPLHNNF